MTYRVTAAYVTAKVPHTGGGFVVTGFYKDAMVPADVDPVDRDRLLAKGMIEPVAPPVAQPEVVKAEPDPPPRAKAKSGDDSGGGVK